jgi:energy-coupling factor transporter transmembrane protein EcfT
MNVIGQNHKHVREVAERLNPGRTDPAHKTQITLAFIFGVVFISLILAIAVFIPQPSLFQYQVFRIVLALAAGGVGAVIPGVLNVNIPKILTAGGALAVFVVVYFYSPAQLAVKKVPSKLINISGKLFRVTPSVKCEARPWLPITKDGDIEIGLMGTSFAERRVDIRTRETADERTIESPETDVSLGKWSKLPTSSRKLEIYVSQMDECSVSYEIKETN